MLHCTSALRRSRWEDALDKIWLQQYPSRVPPEIDVHAYASLKALLEQSCVRFASLPACSNLGTTLTYAELDRHSRAFAAYLQRSLRCAKGDRIALMLPNVLQYPVALFGALRAGLTVVNVNPMYTPRELEHQLCDSGATTIVVLENVAHTLEQVLAKTSIKTVITTRVGDLFPTVKSLLVNALVKYVKRLVPRWHIPGATSFKSALRLGQAQVLELVALTHEDVAFLQYTGGTTGIPKGVVLTHGNMVANAEQLGAWVATRLRQGAETAIIPLPLYHIYALTSWLVFTKLGSHCVLVTDPRDLPAFLKTLRKSNPTAMVGVNTLYRALLDARGFSGLDLSRLRVAASGGMAVQRVVAERWKRATGVPLVEGYGLSETSPVVLSNPVDIEDWTGAAGLPVPSTEVAILDELGQPVPQATVGEICVRGPQVMKGYWNRPEETQKVFTRDGWLRTGDMGTMDARGYVTITDRKKDMIVVSGFKVFPNEIEDVVMMHPDVLEAGAVGIPDEKSGESVKLVVVRRNPNLTEQALLAHCRKYLTAYKLPRLIEFREAPLPKTPIGKILRRQLRPPYDPRASAA
jgi:long-chain acyl-CoA synthetase